MTGRRLLFLILATTASPGLAAAAPPPFSLSAEDRVVFVGNALVEREQAQGYLETELARRRPGQVIVFRNLGWSGDTVFGEARAAFDPPPVGYKRLVEQVTAARPTVLFLGFGGVESFDGAGGLPRFVSGYQTLLDDLAPLKARLVFLGPLAQRDLGRPLPDPTAHNRDVHLYGEAIQKIAAGREGQFVDLLDGLDDVSTADGVLPDQLGLWQLARQIERGLGLEDSPWSVQIDLVGDHPKVTAQGVTTTQVKRFDGGLRFEARDTVLPPCPAPSPGDAARPAPTRKLTIHGLAAGNFRLLLDGHDTGRTVSSDDCERGIDLVDDVSLAQIQQVRAAIVKKNRLEFYRYRPQNETYLYGFRKHEQGRNAAEVVQFDPLVAEQEALIGRLTIPTARTIELRHEVGNPRP